MTALRDVRESRGWDPRIFSARVGVSVNYLGKIEDGEKSPTIKTAQEFSRVLGVDPAEVDEFREIVDHYAWKDMRHPIRKPSTTSGVIYFIQEMESGYIKIGYASSMEHTQSRLQTCRTFNPRPLRIVATQSGTMRDELNLHATFHTHRISGGAEWFRPGQDLLDYIEESCWPYATS